MNRLSSIRCPHFPQCSGCAFVENVHSPEVLKEVFTFFKERGLSSLPLFSGNAEEWRNRAKLAIRGTAQNPTIGLYQRGTHTTLDIPFCRVHHPLINQAVQALKTFIQKEQIQPYNEDNYQGELRYLQLVISSSRAQLTLVVNGHSDPDKWRQFLKENSQIPWHSLWLNTNLRRDNVIFGKEWTLVSGEPWLWETIQGVSVCFHPASFAQANSDLFERLIASLNTSIAPNRSLVEYYAGVGAIGLTLAEKSRKVVCCEINPQAQECFSHSRERLPEEIRSKVAFQLGRSEQHLSLMEDADTLIVDPPRKGLELSLQKALQKLEAPRQLFYISCGWEAFQRDCDALLAADWKLDKVEAYALFPGSDHLELLVSFNKTRSK